MQLTRLIYYPLTHTEHTCHTSITHTAHQTCCIHLSCYTHTPEHQSLHTHIKTYTYHNIHIPHTHTLHAHITQYTNHIHTKKYTHQAYNMYHRHHKCIQMHIPHTLLKTSGFHRKLRLYAHQLKEGQSSSNRNTKLEHSHPLLSCYVFSSSFFVPE